MPDMLVPLYNLPARETMPVAAGYEIRRAVHYEKHTLLQWVETHFSAGWASETDITFSRQPVSCFVATRGNRLVGFACYEVARRGFFGPLGVLDSERGQGLGGRLLLECLYGLEALGYGYGIIFAVGPADFYARTVGATIIPNSDPGLYVSGAEL